MVDAARCSTFRCKIVDKHLAILAPKHLEAKFVKIDAEKAHFLTKRLKIRVLPTVALVRDSKTVDFIVGFDDLGGHDEFSTEMLEWRIARAGVIEYAGDLMQPPDDAAAASSAAAKASILGAVGSKKTIRGSAADDSNDEDDW